ncbi:CRISPR-associated endonuclease Cas1 [Aerosakkonema funiforme]|uniref:CRISPR-associated endonuclease Cas1 n=1 Tax=Aerosakkonema funiforme TaxID=1246630 RepID=UPI0035B7AC5B
MTAIYLTDIKAKVKVKSPYLLVLHNQQTCQKINITQVSQIVLWSRCYLDREVASLVSFRGIPIMFVGNQGENIGSLEHSLKKHPKCLKYQKQRSLDAEFTLAIAESIVRAKLHNCYIVLQRLHKNQPTPVMQTALDVLVMLIDDLAMANSVRELREYAVMAASFYYPALASLLPRRFHFQRRKKQPPTDGINCLLNLGYNLLHQIVEMFLQELGLHPNWGNLYANSQHQSPLACDLMAEFRAPLVDELVAQLAMTEIIQPNDFLPLSQGGVSLHPALLKTFFQYWEEKLQLEIIHPYAGTVSYRQCVQLQVKEYVAFLLGDTNSYRPMVLQVNSAPLHIGLTRKQEVKQLTLVKA